jgi:hypothetical protein
MLRAALVATATAAALTPTIAVASAVPDPNGAWHSPVIVTHDAAPSAGHTAYLTAISCAAAGSCSAIGRYSGVLVKGGDQVDEGFVVDEVDGTWGSPQLLGSDPDEYYRPAAIACPSVGNCVVVGAYTGGGPVGFVMSETDGTWGSPQSVSDAALSSVSCPAVGDCVAAGTEGYGGQAEVVEEDSGTWGTASALPGTLDVDAAITSVSCASPGNCSAGGYYDAQPFGPLPGVGYAMVATETDGTWGSVQDVGGSFSSDGDDIVDTVTSVSCSTAGNCGAVGYYGTFDGTTHAFVMSQSNGTWGDAINSADSLGVSGAQWLSVSCPADGACSAAGYYADAGANLHTMAANEVGGTWKAAKEVAGALNVGKYGQLFSVSCSSAGNCSAAGYYDDSAQGFAALVVTETKGVWGPGQGVAMPGLGDAMAEANSISCPSLGNCAVAGFVDNSDDYSQAMVVNESPASVPSRPTHVMAKAGLASAKVSWTVPSSDGGSVITGYQVTSKPGGKTCTTKATSCVVKGLTAGRRYTFDVVAKNAVGNSAVGVSNGVVALGVPSAPAIQKVSAKGASLTLRWKPPASDGGSAITGYDVYIATKAGAKPTKKVNSALLSPRTRSYRIKKLAAHTTYYVTVRAANRYGLGARAKTTAAHT